MEYNKEENNLSELIHDQSEEDLDPQMTRILEILHDLPEKEIPLSLTQDLKGILKQEGEKIRAELAANKKAKTRKRWLKGIATAVACFVVGFISISMYNDNGLIFNQNMTEQSTVTANKELDKKATDSAVTEKNAKLITDSAVGSGLYGEGNAGNPGTYEAEAKMDGDTMKACPAESRNCVTSRDAFDTTGGPFTLMLAPAGFMGPDLALIEKYLGTSDYEVVSVTPDDKSGGSRYKITIVTDYDGQTVTKTEELVVAEGEVYERDAAK